jgi:FAD synthetase
MEEQKLLQRFQGTSLYPKLKRTIEILKKGIDLYGPKAIGLSFNGGKDCTVLLHLYHQLLLDTGYGRPIRVLYVTTNDPFPEIDEFIQSCQSYNISVETIMGSMKDALDVFIKSNPTTKAILIGTREGDPYSHTMKDFQMTDSSWPQIMRIHPILDWNYHDVWEYLRGLSIPYCSLYDQGYTSLGSTSNTQPNPELFKDGRYLPAYMLQDASLERHGRKQK